MSSLTESQKEIIKASIPFLEEHGVELTAKFYSYMLETNPSIRPFFNKSHQITKKQPKILAFALVNYAKNIDDLTPLLGFVRQIVEKHVGLQVTPEQYNIVGSCLLKTLKEMLGDELATPEFMKAWEVAYFYLANILIKMEKDRYHAELEIPNGWVGFKESVVTDVAYEAKSIKSVTIKPLDGKVAEFQPGQYITIRLPVNGTIQSREYSITNEYSKEGSLKSYRISVRRIPQGVASNFIHDQLKVGDLLEITAPYGKLLEPYMTALKSNKADPVLKSPVIFFIGGIGITPSISCIEFFLQNGNNVHLFYSNDSLETRGFGSWIKRIVNEYPNQLKVEEFITHISEDSLNSLAHTGSNYEVHARRLNPLEDLQSLTKSTVNSYTFFLIGPLNYMNAVTEFLKAQDYDVSKVNSEQYGPVSV